MPLDEHTSFAIDLRRRGHQMDEIFRVLTILDSHKGIAALLDGWTDASNEQRAQIYKNVMAAINE